MWWFGSNEAQPAFGNNSKAACVTRVTPRFHFVQLADEQTLTDGRTVSKSCAPMTGEWEKRFGRFATITVV